MKNLKNDGFGYYEYLRRGGGLFEDYRNIELGKQDSVFIYEDDSDGVQFSYTDKDYREKSSPIKF